MVRGIVFEHVLQIMQRFVLRTVHFIFSLSVKDGEHKADIL